MISPVSAVIPDLLMVAAIWYHAYKIRLSNVMQVDVPYTTILLRDGEWHSSSETSVPDETIIRHFVFHVGAGSGK